MEQTPHHESREERERLWLEKLKSLDFVADKLGQGMDEGIKAAVAGMNLNGFPTTSSCGGHIEQVKVGFPYVQGKPVHEPENRYVGEKEIAEQIMNKHGLKDKGSIYDDGPIEKEYHEELYKEDRDETEEYKRWYKESKELTSRVSTLLEEYKNVNPSSTLHLKPIYPGYRIEAHNIDNDKKYERTDIEEMVREAQRQFGSFAAFLKKRFIES